MAKRIIAQHKLKFPRLAWGCWDNSSNNGNFTKDYTDLTADYHKGFIGGQSSLFVYCSWHTDHSPVYYTSHLSEAINYCLMQLKDRTDPMDSCEIAPGHKASTDIRNLKRYRTLAKIEPPRTKKKVMVGLSNTNWWIKMLGRYPHTIYQKIARTGLDLVDVEANDPIYSINKSSSGLYIMYDRIDCQHYTLDSSEYKLVDHKAGYDLNGITYDYLAGDVSMKQPRHWVDKKIDVHPDEAIIIEGMLDDDGNPIIYDRSEQPCLTYKRSDRDLDKELERIRQLPPDDLD